MTFQADWKAAKDKFTQRTNGLKKPSKKFLGIRVTTGIESSLKKLDAALLKQDVPAVTAAVASFRTAKVAYAKLLEDTMAEARKKATEVAKTNPDEAKNIRIVIGPSQTLLDTLETLFGQAENAGVNLAFCTVEEALPPRVLDLLAKSKFLASANVKGWFESKESRMNPAAPDQPHAASVKALVEAKKTFVDYKQRLALHNAALRSKMLRGKALADTAKLVKKLIELVGFSGFQANIQAWMEAQEKAAKAGDLEQGAYEEYCKDNAGWDHARKAGPVIQDELEMLNEVQGLLNRAL